MSNVLKRKITHSQTEVTDVINPKRTKPATTRFSAWYVTICPNVRFDDPNDPNLIPYSNLLAQTIDELLNDDEDFKSILVFNTRVKNHEVDNALSEFHVERGPETGMVHAHGSSKSNTSPISCWVTKNFESISFGSSCGPVKRPIYLCQRGCI